MRVLPAPVALGGVLAVVAVHLVEPLRPGVPGLEIVVRQRPRRRDAVDVLELLQIPRSQAVQRRAVQLGGAADVVVDLRLEGLAVGVVPGVFRDVASLGEHRVRAPVLGLAGQEVAPFQQQDALAAGRERVGQRPAARSGADHDHVVVLGQRVLPAWSCRRAGQREREATEAGRCAGAWWSRSSWSSPQSIRQASLRSSTCGPRVLVK